MKYYTYYRLKYDYQGNIDDIEYINEFRNLYEVKKFTGSNSEYIKKCVYKAFTPSKIKDTMVDNTGSYILIMSD